MTYSTIISAAELKDLMSSTKPVVVDCRFDLADIDAGEIQYYESHIPGAVYAHLDRDLSDTILPGITGRHPLPKLEDSVATLSGWGIDTGKQVVAYDGGNGAYAARLWWMLKWLGHDNVAVLDGGWAAWTELEGEATALPSRTQRASFIPSIRNDMLVSVDELTDETFCSNFLLLDARAEERYLGIVEPLDPVGGHIPGAVCVPFGDNLLENGRFKSRTQLRERFLPYLTGRSAKEIICYCGSGVTAAHNALAMEHAGLGCPRVYAGSWSEWVTDPKRPVARNPEG